MTPRQFYELKRDLLDQVGRRMDRVEKKVDHMAESCVGCSREFGETTARLALHLEEHADTWQKVGAYLEDHAAQTEPPVTEM